MIFTILGLFLYTPNEGRSILWIGAIDTGLGYIADTHYYQIDLYFSCFAGIPSEIDLCVQGWIPQKALSKSSKNYLLFPC